MRTKNYRLTPLTQNSNFSWNVSVSGNLENARLFEVKY